MHSRMTVHSTQPIPYKTDDCLRSLLSKDTLPMESKSKSALLPFHITRESQVFSPKHDALELLKKYGGFPGMPLMLYQR
jgi:hypothetical protein